MIDAEKLVKTRFRLLKIFPLNSSINLLNYLSDLNIFNWSITEIIKLVELERVLNIQVLCKVYNNQLTLDKSILAYFLKKAYRELFY